ncbi:hypothetical protein [uncultured Thiodictyon sp.]|uniref:hypothetical protein n=1 Tax=uncultured Thiodictyon sp. TaxID=1846217 RepID=UPI0025D0145E|nr:hypothetical protein [uncultured Thiodictyon sp.]
MEIPNAPKPLLEITKELLSQASKRWTRKTIAKEADVKIDWLNMFAQNRIPKPGVIPIQKLHDYLAVKLTEPELPKQTARHTKAAHCPLCLTRLRQAPTQEEASA